MKETSILAHLARRFPMVAAEPLATEALCYLAQNYESVRLTLANLASRGQHDPAAVVRVSFRSEARAESDAGIPDLAGQDGMESLVLIEGKFRAGLTKHQPGTYLERLAPGGTLLFVCPSWRVTDLLEKAGARAAEKGFTQQGSAVVDNDAIHWLVLANDKHLAVTGWGDLLRLLETRAASDDLRLSGEISQLRALVQQFEESLMEWNREQLLNPTFGNLFEMGVMAAQQAVGILKAETGSVSQPSWKMVTNLNYMTYADLGNFRLVIGFSPADWGRPSPSPLYFTLSRVNAPKDTHSALYEIYLRIMKDINERLRADFDGLEFPPREQDDDYWWGPLPLAFDVSEVEGHADLQTTIRAILTYVAELQAQ